jgi:predicted DNA-binding antitoxin AbrB/MazE fold protein
MSQVGHVRATLDDLYRTPEKAELIGGRIVPTVQLFSSWALCYTAAAWNSSPQGVSRMTITVEAVYENGMLRLANPLPFREHEKVQVTVHSPANWVRETAGITRCADHKLIEYAAMDPELDFPSREES